MNCKIAGYEFKTLHVTLAPGEEFYAERGSIVYADEALRHTVALTNQDKGLGSVIRGAVKSALSGESFLIIRFSNTTNVEKKLILSGSVCTLLPIKLQGEYLICRRGHYVASTGKVSLNLNINVQGLLSGVGLFQKIEGNATVFLDSAGNPIEKLLGHAETIKVDENHIIALFGISSSQIQSRWSVGNVLSGEGLSLMEITGPGKVYLSPLSI